MSQLPYLQSDDPILNQLQTKWRSELNPLLAIPFLSGNQINNITITSGSATVINHKLGKIMQGWIVTNIDTPSAIYRLGPFNDKTISLKTDLPPATISLWVY